MLQQAVLEMPKEEAEYHIKRCIDSGLWVPSAADAEKQEVAEGAEGASGGPEDVGDDGDEKYEQVDWPCTFWSVCVTWDL